VNAGAKRQVSPRKPDEPVRLTRIYTRGGDRGETSLGDGSRVSKLDSRVAAYGAVDELNSQLGLVLALNDLAPDLRAPLERIQNELFDLGADLSVPFAPVGDERLRVTQPQVDELERLCDEHNERLPELKSFVLPGGSEAAARLHVARAVCRRAELATLAAAREVELDPLVPVYLNRLSDLLFIFARVSNSGDEPLWRPGG
jgi:cob(I)alamin adenosyltransferase